jgi:hypothetical protein
MKNKIQPAQYDPYTLIKMSQEVYKEISILLIQLKLME